MRKRLFLTIFLLSIAFLYTGMAKAASVVTTTPSGPDGINPQVIKVNTTTGRIYVVNENSNNISVMDGATNREITKVTVGKSPVGIDVNPTTNPIDVAN